MAAHHSVVSEVQVKIEKAQEINGLLNVFEGAYYHTNDKIHVHCYKKKTTAKQSVDFSKKSG